VDAHEGYVVATVIAVANQKGGVGKTTTTLNLGFTLAHSGKRVLLVDMDPQGNLTAGAGAVGKCATTVADALLDRAKPLPVVAVDGAVRGSLAVVPASLALSTAEASLLNRLGREFRLRDQLLAVERGYDYVLIDTPPSLGVLTINALVAANFVLIPTEARYFSLEGLRMLQDSVEEVKYLNPRLRVLGIVVSKYDRRLKEERIVSSYLRQTWGDLVMKTEVGTNSKILEAASGGMSIFEIAGGERAVETYESLTGEVLARG
jgi:chromosome partitioning protein